MGDFYLTLPSNSSMSQYPDNHGGHFYTKLPQSLDLSTIDYEVGLAEIQYSNTFSNVRHNEAWFIFKSGEDHSTETVYVPQGLYESNEVLIDSLNFLMRKKYDPRNKRDPRMKFLYNKTTRKAAVKLYRENQFLKLNPFLTETLSLDSNT